MHLFSRFLAKSVLSRSYCVNEHMCHGLSSSIVLAF